VLAAELAAMGFTGPTQIYEYGDGGVLKAHSDDSDAALLTRDLGRVWHTETNSIKPYSCCGSAHAYIDAALAVRNRIGAPWDAKRRVKVGLSNVVDVQCGFDYAPSSALNAQMSLRYAVAVALMEGAALPAQFTDAKMNDPAIVGLAQGMEDVAHEFPAGEVVVLQHGLAIRVEGFDQRLGQLFLRQFAPVVLAREQRAPVGGCGVVGGREDGGHVRSGRRPTGQL